MYFFFFFFNDTATTEIYTGWYTLSLHDALPIDGLGVAAQRANELFLAAELRAHALELEVLRADLAAKLRSLLGLGLERVDQLILPVEAPLERLDLVVAPLLAAFELGDARARVLELLEHERNLAPPIGQEPGQAIAEPFNRRLVGHCGVFPADDVLPSFRGGITVNHVTNATPAGAEAKLRLSPRAIEPASAKAILQRGERVGAGAKGLERNRVQRRFDRAVDFVQIGRALIDVQEPGHDLAGPLVSTHVADRLAAVADLEILRDLPEQHPAAIVQLDRQHVARVVGRLDIARGRHEVRVDHAMTELPRVRVALRRVLVIVERHARRQHVDQREAAVADSGLDQRHELLLVAREAARDERAAERERDLDRVDRRLLVHLAALRLRADVRRRRELPLREPVHAVVLDDVDHVEVATQRMHELTDPDRQRVTVAGHAEQIEAAVS